MSDNLTTCGLCSLLPAVTEVRTPPLVPETSLHLAPEGQSLDAFRTANENELGATVPYWAVPWPGGQALARYLLDHPNIVRGRSVADCGAGLAAALAGAAEVRAIDRDTNALSAARANGKLNKVSVETELSDFASANMEDVDVVLAGDLWYERFDARKSTAALRQLADAGLTVLVGDNRRTHFPRQGIELLARYDVPTDQALERSDRVEAIVARLLP